MADWNAGSNPNYMRIANDAVEIIAQLLCCVTASGLRIFDWIAVPFKLSTKAVVLGGTEIFKSVFLESLLPLLPESAPILMKTEKRSSDGEPLLPLVLAVIDVCLQEHGEVLTLTGDFGQFTNFMR